MALSSFVTVLPQHQTEQPSGFPETTSLFAALLLAIYAVQKSKKQLKKLRRKLAFTYLKEILHRKFNKVRALFSKRPPPVSDKALLYILLALVVLVLIFIEPVVAIAVLLLGILIILLTQHGFASKN